MCGNLGIKMSKIKLHLGCGWRNFGKDWVHIDGGDYPHLDGKDISKLDYLNNEVDLIYASHVIAYFDRDEVLPLLKEWYRVLKPNGVLRLATPNFESMSKLYEKNKYPLSTFLGPIFGKMEMGDEIIYHRTIYDFNDLKNILSDCGFVDVSLYDWRLTEHSKHDDHSQAYVPHMDKKNGKLISLNIECKK